MCICICMRSRIFARASECACCLNTCASAHALVLAHAIAHANAHEITRAIAHAIEFRFALAVALEQFYLYSHARDEVPAKSALSHIRIHICMRICICICMRTRKLTPMRIGMLRHAYEGGCPCPRPCTGTRSPYAYRQMHARRRTCKHKHKRRPTCTRMSRSIRM